MADTFSADTIAAVATPVGSGGIGVIRLSGPQVPAIARYLLGRLPKPRHATLAIFRDTEGVALDKGITLYFPAPHSFTGEDVLELQGHGGPVVMDALLQASLQAGARLARPGEFSERAFLNGRIDLAQAEAIADLIDSASIQAARSAMRSLQGIFSQRIQVLVDDLIVLRAYIEAGIDFVDEEVDVLADGQVADRLNALCSAVQQIQDSARQGSVLREGLHLVIVGAPNVGKSSLLNCLAGRETAIVTPIAGTTRDIVREQILLDGIPLHITDTAGLRETTDVVEQEGIRRAHQALQDADSVLWLRDDTQTDTTAPAALSATTAPLLIVHNKIDLSGHPSGVVDERTVYLSARTGEGLDDLRRMLKSMVGLHQAPESGFLARRRHLDALQRAAMALEVACTHLETRQQELLAEELRQAQLALSGITGEFTADDLLGRIFSTFCIGK